MHINEAYEETNIITNSVKIGFRVLILVLRLRFQTKLLYVHSSFTIIWMGKRDLVGLPSLSS